MIEILAGYAEPQQQMVHSVANGGTSWTEVVVALTAVITVVLMVVGLVLKYRRKQGK
jgi:uncharacterized iron-regulated membrane protein